MNMSDIDRLTQQYADAFQQLADSMARLDEDVRAVKRHHLPAIKPQIDAVTNHRNALHEAIAQNPQLFEKPRTVVLHGVKVGIQKGKGRLVIEDEQKTIRLIRRHMLADEDMLIIVKESVSRAGLGKLPAAQLKKLAVSVTDAIDKVVIKPTQSDVEKAIDALIKDGLEEFDVEGAA